VSTLNHPLIRHSLERPDTHRPARFYCARRPLFRALLGLLLLLSVVPAMALEIIITGVDEMTQRNILTFVGQPEGDDRASLRRFTSTLPSNADTAMQAIGYYNAKYDISIDSQAAVPSITVAVTPGEPVRLSRLILNINGSARLDGGYMPAIGRIPIRLNGIFTHADYEATKDALLDAAQDRGYFDFELSTSSVRVSRTQNTAEVTLIAESGLRYTFADAVFDTDYFDDSFLQRLLPFEVGDYYESSVLAEITQGYQQTGFFSTVRVTPKYDPVYSKQVPIFIELRRKDKNQIGLGAGFATDTLWRTRFTWNKPLINTSGHSFNSELGLSAVEQSVSFQYRIPRTNNPLTNYWSVEYGLLHSDVEDTESTLSTLNLQHTRETFGNWRESLFVRWERELSVIGDVEDELDLILPGINYSKSVSEGTPFPTAGYTANFRLLYGSRLLFSDIDLYKAVLNYKWLHTVGKLNTFILSFQYGALGSNDLTRVPVSQRFFAGGDRTIRGFDFRSISPLDDEGVAIGARYLEVNSVEYNYRFRPRWSAAVFVDAGRAFNDFDQSYSVGTGIGLRWLSPVGPFRVDVATDISEDDPGLTLHLSLGPDL